MATQKYQYYPQAPGPQNPSKYFSTGPNYAKWGEQPGWVYWPYTDSYFIDKKAAEKQLQDSGQIDKPKETSLSDILVPTAAIAGTTALATQLPGIIRDQFVAGAVGNAATQATAGLPAVAPTVGSEAAAGGSGLMASGVSGAGAEAGATTGGAAGVASEGGFFSSPAAGTLIGVPLGLLAYDQAKKGNQGASTGLGVASGAAIGSAILPGPGTGIGAVIGGLAGWLGGRKTTKMLQEERRNKLLKQNITGYNQAYEISKQPTGIDTKNLDPMFMGEVAGANGQKYWVNKAFETTGDEKYFRPGDIIGDDLMVETFGNDWWGKYTPQQRIALTQAAINEGIRNHQGMNDFVNKESKTRLQQMGQRMAAGSIPTPSLDMGGNVIGAQPQTQQQAFQAQAQQPAATTQQPTYTQPSANQAQGLLKVGSQVTSTNPAFKVVDAGTLKRWRESNEKLGKNK